MNTCKSIAIYNFKGGVGKTSTTLHLAKSWSKRFKILVIDCDPQNNLTLALCGSTLHKQTLNSICKTYLHNSQTVIKPISITPYLDLIPGDFEMVQMESNHQFMAFGPHIMQKILRNLKDEYDMILLDCPTHFGSTVQSAIASADSILIPASPDSFSLSGFHMLIDYLETIKRDNPLNILGLFFNQYKKFTLLHQHVFNEAKSTLGNLVFNQTIRDSIKVCESNTSQMTPKSGTAKNNFMDDYLSLSEEVFERLHVSFLYQVSEHLKQA